MAFISIAMTGILLAGALGMWNTHTVRDFRHFQMEHLPQIAEELVQFYEDNDGVWTKGNDDPPVPAYVELYDHNRKPIREPGQRDRDRFLKQWQVYAIPERAILSDGEAIGYLRIVKVPPALEPPAQPLADQSPLAFLGFGAILLTAGVSGVFMSKRITQPLQELTNATHAVASGDLEHRVPERSQDEIGRLARAFNRMSVQLQESEAQKRQMTQDIIHDIAQPIVVIRGLAEAMRDKVLDRSEENLEIILQESGRLEALARSLHLLEVADASRIQLHRERIAPAVLLERFMKMYEGPARQEGLTFHCEVPDALPLVDVDVERVIQALGNLANNALQYAPAGSVVTLQAAADPEYVRLSVADEGPGVAPEDLTRIFDRFYRADKARSPLPSGSGIGLAIVSSLLKAHGGSAWAENVEPHGLRVVLALPVASADETVDATA